MVKILLTISFKMYANDWNEHHVRSNRCVNDDTESTERKAWNCKLSKDYRRRGPSSRADSEYSLRGIDDNRPSIVITGAVIAFIK